MKKSYEEKQIIILINQLFMIIFLSFEFLHNDFVGTAKVVPLMLITIMAIEGSYIGFVNIKEKNILSQFSNLLLLTAWQFLLTLNESQTFYKLSTLLSVVILYKTVQFLLLFFFQDTTYSYKKVKDWLLKSICWLTLIAIFMNDRLFAILFLCQLVLSFGCIIFLFSKHRKRITFVLKSEKKHLLKSFAVIILPFIGYVLLFAKSPEYLSNLGWYIMIFFPLFSIHAIAFKNNKVMKKYIPLKGGNLGLIFLVSLFCIILFGIMYRFNIITYIIIIHTVFWFVLLYFTLLYKDIKKSILNLDTEEPKILQDSFYTHTLLQIAKEEEIKKDFSNYLHDEILQDILSIKNMMNKSEKEDIHKIIVKTLDNLNMSIREQMQEYHPTLLRSLTLEENYRNLLELLSQKYRLKKINISFNCDENLFLVEPYHLVIYRFIKELVTNSLKHSKCSKLVVNLTQENDEIELIVEDDGIGLENKEKFASISHKGLNSIKEQLFLLNGKMTISDCTPSGLRVAILIPMKGDDSYQNFINR